MKRLVLFLAILAFGVFASALPQPATAAGGWPALLINCSDVTGTGYVDGFDIGEVVSEFGHAYPAANYMLLYDLTGTGWVDGFDIATVVQDFGLVCPDMFDTQVAQATLAMTGAYESQGGPPDLRDPQNALDAGYIKSSQMVPAMGVHLFNADYMKDYPDCCSLGLPGEPGESQLIHPVGLVYSAGTQTDMGLGRLIGAWYIQPNDVVCGFYGITTTCMPEDQSPSAVQPVGFGLTNADEDNFDPDGGGPQGGWHFHIGLCIWNWGTASATVFEGLSQTSCEPSGIWFSTYGWMMHLYNFIPNDAGRFQKWNYKNIP